MRIAIDSGGTFTDCVYLDDRQLKVLKLFSTPQQPSHAVLDAVLQVTHDGARPEVRHGTTVGTNAMLERRGACVAYVTTIGFEDVIAIGRQARPSLYDWFRSPMNCIVSAPFRFGVEERTSAEREILRMPTPEHLARLRERIRESGAESIALSLLFSFANPHNERLVAQALEPLGLPISISHEILPEFREYERGSTVVTNAYLAPMVSGYIRELERSLTEPSPAGPVQVMQSSGGIASASLSAREPVRTVLSGPAGGVIGAYRIACVAGFTKVIGFDMGGTSTDVSLMDAAEGGPKTTNESVVSELPVSVPMLDIHTVGAGGGSLARFDEGGGLHVGPESAGADPGPICYRRVIQPTVTDANLLLGRLQPARFLGGDFTLDLDRTHRITREWLKTQRSKLKLDQFAAGVIRVVNANMEKAMRVVSVERGRDPRHFALVAFGGAGGLNACALAEALSIPRVIIPAFPGALSALGILASDVVKDYSRTVLWRVSGKVPQAQLSQEFAALEKTAAKDFRDEAWQGSPRYARSVDLRYRGQGYELNLPLTKSLLKSFAQEHHRRYGYTHPNRELELVTLRLRAIVRTARSRAGADAFVRPGRATLGGISAPRAEVQFDGKKLPTKIYERDDLRPGKNYFGPALITEYSATTVIPPGGKFRVDRAANLIVTIP